MESRNESIRDIKQIELASEYLLAEFEMLHQRASLQEQTAANKINFFLVAVTAVVGGVFILSDNQTLAPYFLPAAVLTIAFMLLMGLSTLFQVLDLAANSTFYYRRTGRIRRWFLDCEPSLIKYMPFVVADDKPSFLADRGFLRGLESLLVLLNAVLSATFTFFLFLFVAQQLVSPQDSFVVFALIAGILIFCVIWYLQVAYYKRFLISIEQHEIARNHVHFPDKEAKRYYTSKVIDTDKAKDVNDNMPNVKTESS